MATKSELAIELYKQNEGITNEAFIELLMTNLQMTKLGARTYCYNVRKQLGVSIPSRAARQPKADKPAKAAKAPKAATSEAKTSTQRDQPRKITNYRIMTKPRTLENSKHVAQPVEATQEAA